MNRTQSRETQNTEKAMPNEKYGQFNEHNERNPPFVKSYSDRGYSNDRVPDSHVERGLPMDRTRSERMEAPVRPVERPFPSAGVKDSLVEVEVDMVETPLQAELRRLRQEEQKMLLEMERIKFEHDRSQREAGRFGILYEIAERELGIVDDPTF
jgi:hypothetical protein